VDLDFDLRYSRKSQGMITLAEFHSGCSVGKLVGLLGLKYARTKTSTIWSCSFSKGSRARPCEGEIELPSITEPSDPLWAALYSIKGGEKNCEIKVKKPTAIAELFFAEIYPSEEMIDINHWGRFQTAL
jgi:hypothetical protein